jgi:hypothetical protein
MLEWNTLAQLFGQCGKNTHLADIHNDEPLLSPRSGAAIPLVPGLLGYKNHSL